MVPLGSCQDHVIQHPAVLISHGFGHVFSNLQNMLFATQTPATLPKPAALAGGSCKKQKLPSNSSVGSHEPELAVPQHPCAVPKSQLGHQLWEWGKGESGGRSISSTLVILSKQELFPNPADTDVYSHRGPSPSMHIREFLGGGTAGRSLAGAAGAAR